MTQVQAYQWIFSILFKVQNTVQLMADGQLTSIGLLVKMVLKKVLGSVTILNQDLEENCAQEQTTLRSNVKSVMELFCTMKNFSQIGQYVLCSDPKCLYKLPFYIQGTSASDHQLTRYILC